jgi:hypothetical protein
MQRRVRCSDVCVVRFQDDVSRHRGGLIHSSSSDISVRISRHIFGMRITHVAFAIPKQVGK